MSKMGSERQVTIDPSVSVTDWKEVRPGVFQTIHPGTNKPFGQEFIKQPDGRLVPTPQKRSMFQGLFDSYQENIGQPFVRSTPGQMLAGFLGVESQGTNPEAYQFGQGASMVPGLGAPAGIFKAAAQIPNMIDVGQTGLGLIFGAKALKNGVTAKDAITAEQLLKNGVPPNQIFQAGQGLFKGPDGSWRRMTNDFPFEKSFTRNIESLKSADILHGDYELQQLYTNSALFDAYPELRKVKVTFDPTMAAHQEGSFNPITKTLRLNPSKDPKSMHETFVHEMQHYIQGKEGWQQGGNSFSMLPENAKQATAHAETALAKIKDRMQIASEKYNIPRAEIAAAARYQAAKKIGATPTKEELDAFRKLSNAPAEIQSIMKDSVSYADIQSQLGEYRDTAYKHYRNLQGEAEAREVERQLKLVREGGSLQNPNGKYDNLRFDDLIKRGDKTSYGVDIDWKETGFENPFYKGIR